MITQWITVKPVIARIVRNIKGVDADYLTDIPEWIAEAIFKLQTTYQLVLECADVDIKFHQGLMPCKAEALAAVAYNGQRLMIGDGTAPLISSSTSAQSAFYSVITLPDGINSIDQTDINNWPFYLNTVESLSLMPVCSGQFYRPKYNKIETSIETGKLRVYYWVTPHDEDGLPMVPKNENYQTAVYWYCRMMMIGAGFEDRVFSYKEANAEWDKYANYAINEITYPTIDEKKRNIMNNVSLIPHMYDWELFGGGGPELQFNDDL